MESHGAVHQILGELARWHLRSLATSRLEVALMMLVNGRQAPELLISQRLFDIQEPPPVNGLQAGARLIDSIVSLNLMYPFMFSDEPLL